MNLSNRAHRYLNKIDRDKDFITNNKEQIIAYLENQHIAPFNKIIDFQTNYSAANDDYNKWLRHENLIINIGTWFNKPTSFLHLYGNDYQHCEEFIQLLKDKKIIS